MMSELNLKELGKELKKQQAIADMDPGTTDPNQRRMRLGNIMQAKEKIQALQLEYNKLILANAIFIIATGKEAKKFASVAEKSCGCFSVNAEDFYADLIKDVPPELYVNKTSSGNLLEFIGNNLEEKARTLNVVSYPGLVMESKYKKVLKDEADLLILTKAIINEKVGGEIVGIDAANRISTKLLKSKNSGKKVPIVLRVEDESMVEEIAKGLKRSLTRKTFIIGAGDTLEKTQTISFDSLAEVTEEAVEQSLMKLNKTIN
jgi:hypothetical protein